MEAILRSAQMASIKTEFDRPAQIKLLPIRHHSPACAFQVQQVIESWQPTHLLIEGPDNANAYIPAVTDAATKPPFALYYSYDDRTAILSEEKEKYRCYYPFLDYSPELAALRTGARLGIQSAFIDMPYGDILAACTAGNGLLKKDEKSSYNDDYLLARSTYIQLLIEKTGVRSFDEFWEKYFEINGFSQDCALWFSNLLTHCALSRESSSEEELFAEGCIQREAYMAEKILAYAKENPRARILVITGGFHTPALSSRIADHAAEHAKAPVAAETVCAPRVPQSDQRVYLMPYSMQAADALNGYASGMPFPAFYQSVCEKQSYRTAVYDFIIQCGKTVRKKDGSISTFDEICACQMADGLAALRGKIEPGAYELSDAILSCFIKGEYNLSTDLPMQELKRQLTGDQIGSLCRQAEEPPLLQDFRQQCQRFQLKLSTSIEQLTLSIFAKKKHRHISMFFHRLTFLDANFAQRKKGPNLQSGQNRNLMREIWSYQWNTLVSAALIDTSVYGATIEEAVCSRLDEELKKQLSARESALLLTQVFEMGLEQQQETVRARVYELLLADTDFDSLTAALRTLTMLHELSSLYQSKLKLSPLLSICCRKTIRLLPTLSHVKEDAQDSAMRALKTLYQVTAQSALPEVCELRESYIEALVQMQADIHLPAGISGCIQGILYGCGRESAAQTQARCRSYLSATREQQMKTAQFFHGLFFTAKDFVFVGEQFFAMLDEFLQQVSQEDFLVLLPELHLAFTYFTPNEIHRIAASVAALHHRQADDIYQTKGIPPHIFTYASALDASVAQQLCGEAVKKGS